MDNQIPMTAKIETSKIVRFVRGTSLMLVVLGVSILIAPSMGYGQQTGAAAYSSLPDWSGTWSMQGGTVFDRATMQPPTAGAGPAGREHPPFTDAWEKVYTANHEKVIAGTFPDPLTFCGIPAGFPRSFNAPDLYEFVLRPEQVWLLTENGPNVTRVYTDGSPLPGPDERWPTYSGWSAGHWEGDTLVFETVGAKGWKDNDAIIDRTGLVLSENAHYTTRIRKTDDTTLEMKMVITDSTALKAPWNVTKTFKKQPKGAHIYDYACNENNRNPVDEQGRTGLKGPDGSLLTDKE